MLSKRAYRLSRFWRWVALVLLLTHGGLLAYGGSPFSQGRCECKHGPEVPCDCPHHRASAGEAGDELDADLPPCHRAMKATAPPSERTEDTGWRNHCDSSDPSLVVFALLELTGADPPEAVPFTSSRWPPPPQLRLERAIAPPRAPPRA